MELQLRLALPTNPLPANGFDLNTGVCDQKDPAPGIISAKSGGLARSFEVCSPFRPTLPVLQWNNQPNDDDDDPKDLGRAATFSIDENVGEENRLVGWPPIKTRRKRVYMQKRGGGPAGENHRAVGNSGGICQRGRGSNSQYVKVKVEGVGIARKVDLSLYDSFAALRATLMDMFDEKALNRYTLTYQDMEGDWLIADDVAWRNFIRTVQRIKLEKILV